MYSLGGCRVSVYMCIPTIDTEEKNFNQLIERVLNETVILTYNNNKANALLLHYLNGVKYNTINRILHVFKIHVKPTAAASTRNSILFD